MVIADAEYPVRPAFGLLAKLLEEFTSQTPANSYVGNTNLTPNSIAFPKLQSAIVQYQDPKQADTIMRVQAELDETKIILHKVCRCV